MSICRASFDLKWTAHSLGCGHSEPQHRQCLLPVVTQNITTDSRWPISSNPDAVFNDPSRRDCNLRIPLCQLAQVSAAAPVCFPPDILKWDPDDESKAFVFVDRGGTPYNNPAFLLYGMATSARYRSGWKTGRSCLAQVCAAFSG